MSSPKWRRAALPRNPSAKDTRARRGGPRGGGSHEIMNSWGGRQACAALVTQQGVAPRVEQSRVGPTRFRSRGGSAQELRSCSRRRAEARTAPS